MSSAFVPSSAVTWFGIPESDRDRARRFYEEVLGTRLSDEEMGAQTYAKFPSEPSGTPGCVIAAPYLQPGRVGTMIYLACADIDAALDRVAAAGGTVLAPKMALPGGMGHIAQIADSEGNYVGLHQG